MKKEIIVGFLLLFQGVLCLAQKDTREIIDAHQIESIRIDTDEVYLLNLIAKETSQIKISTHSEGEYFNDILLETSIVGNELIIKTKYPKQLAGGFDKLSAHKVFSLEIKLEIPENLEVIINSNIASLQGKGDFKSVYADLKQGYCKLLDFSGSAVINTFSGNILIETNSGLIEAETRNGTLDIPEFLPGRKPLRLTSIDGDIMVRKN